MREDVSVEELIDVIEGNRKYVRCLYVWNKADTVTMEDVDRLAREPHSIVISCNLEVCGWGWGQARLSAAVWGPRYALGTRQCDYSALLRPRRNANHLQVVECVVHEAYAHLYNSSHASSHASSRLRSSTPLLAAQPRPPRRQGLGLPGAHAVRRAGVYCVRRQYEEQAPRTRAIPRLPPISSSRPP